MPNPKQSRAEKSSSRDIDWFSRGRTAFAEGRDCFFDDARVRGDQRQAWYDGWNHQARLNNISKLSESDRAEAVANLQNIRESLNAAPEGLAAMAPAAPSAHDQAWERNFVVPIGREMKKRGIAYMVLILLGDGKLAYTLDKEIPPNGESSDVCPPLASPSETPRTGTRSPR